MTAFALFVRRNKHKIPSVLRADGKSDIGAWQRSAKGLFDALSAEERETYRREAAALSEQSNTNGSGGDEEQDELMAQHQAR